MGALPGRIEVVAGARRGRAVAALAGDPDVATKSGRIHFVADLAVDYGFTDVDGRQIPRFAP
jgi:hypothetical protein